jgi:FkbM family methyltransferase
LIEVGWRCYTVGVGEDMTFDNALADMGCKVIAIDPTPRAIAHFHRFARSTIELQEYALWVEDGETEFFEPQNPHHVSHSIGDMQHTGQSITVQTRSLPSLAKELGHDDIQLIKLDIEGAEFEVLQRLDLRALDVRILCVEYHNRDGVRAMLKSVDHVKAQGYEPVHVHMTDVTFVRVV